MIFVVIILKLIRIPQAEHELAVAANSREFINANRQFNAANVSQTSQRRVVHAQHGIVRITHDELVRTALGDSFSLDVALQVGGADESAIQISFRRRISACRSDSWRRRCTGRNKVARMSTRLRSVLAMSSCLNGSWMGVNANLPRRENPSSMLGEAMNDASVLPNMAALISFSRSLSSCASLSASSKCCVNSPVPLAWTLCIYVCCSARNALVRFLTSSKVTSLDSLAAVQLDKHSRFVCVDRGHQCVGCFVDVLERYLTGNVDLLAYWVAMLSNRQLGLVEQLVQFGSWVAQLRQKWSQPAKKSDNENWWWIVKHWTRFSHIFSYSCSADDSVIGISDSVVLEVPWGLFSPAVAASGADAFRLEVSLRSVAYSDLRWSWRNSLHCVHRSSIIFSEFACSICIIIDERFASLTTATTTTTITSINYTWHLKRELVDEKLTTKS